MKHMVCQIPYCRKNKTITFGIEPITYFKTEELFRDDQCINVIPTSYKIVGNEFQNKLNEQEAERVYTQTSIDGKENMLIAIRDEKSNQTYKIVITGGMKVGGIEVCF